MQVNALNQRIGKIPRKSINKDIYFRTCNMFIFNENKLYVQKRASTVNAFPGYWDFTPGGVVRINETDLEAVLREIQEEMGVTPKDIKKLATVSIENEGWFWWSTFFRGVCKDPVVLSEEVEEYKLMDLSEIKERIKQGEKFNPMCLAGLQFLV